MKDQTYLERAQKWMSDDFEPAVRTAVIELRNNDPKGFEDAFYKNLEFGTGGLRGIMGVGTNRMNKYTVGMATQGLANYIKANVGQGQKLCVSYDSRNNSKKFAKITSEVLQANGMHVFLFENIRPTPELSYAIRKTGSVAGVMVTASHNPKQYNGYKVFWNDGAQIISPVDKGIIDEVSKIEGPDQVKFEAKEECGEIQLMGAEMDNAYLDDILSLMLSPESRKRHSDLKFVYTPLHGCGVKLVPECLRRLGFENVFHVPEQDVSDGNFPTVKSPNPEEPSALAMAIERANETGADIVLATDPDADRMGIAVRDNEGKMILLNGNQTASLLVYYILTRRAELGTLKNKTEEENHVGPYVVKTIVTSELIRKICNKFGLKVYDVLTGFKYIAGIVRENEGKGEFICGGEESYGFNVGEFVRDKDAQISCSMVAECAAWAADQGLTLYQLLQKIYKEFGYVKEKMIYIVREGKDGAEEIRQIMENFRHNPPKEIAKAKVTEVIDYLDTEKTGLPSSDVLQFFTDRGDKVSIRPSGTEPKIKFYFGAEGDDADKRLEELGEDFTGRLLR